MLVTYPFRPVNQPSLELVRLQQVVHRLPVLRGGLHDHPGHTQFDKPIGQHQQTRGQGGAVHDLLLTATGSGRVGDADAHHHLGLTDIDRRDPLDDLIAVFDPLHAIAPSLTA